LTKVNLIRDHPLTWRMVKGARKGVCRYYTAQGRPPRRDSILCLGLEGAWRPCLDREICLEVAPGQRRGVDSKR